jgi:beta-glucosidase
MAPDTAAVINQLTLEEKAALCTGASAWSTTPVERLGIPEMIVSDGPHGVRRVPDVHSMGMKSLPATCFPTASCVASTWDLDLVRQMGNALGEECLALNVDVLLGPGVNLKRSPLGGRNFEYFSEDPYLAGEVAAGFIDGVQSKGVGTSLKHFAVNNQEFQRFSISAEVDVRAMREMYLTAFEKAVKQARPWTVMCSYNKVNGVFASEHYELLTEILKGEWGFDGLVVSDWGAVRDRVASLKAGLDWEMPGPQDRRVKAVVQAVRSGDLDEDILTESVRRILRVIARAKRTPKDGTFDVDRHHNLAYKIATEGIVLLKNDGTLPLREQRRIAVIGRSALKAHFQGGGSSHINATRVAVPFDELRSRAEDAELSYAEGYPEDASFREDLIEEAVTLAQGAEVALLYIALPTFKESEGYDRRDLDLTEQQIALIRAVSAAQPNTVVVLNNGAPVAMREWIDSVSAVVEGWMMGQAGGSAIADILFGLVNPSGKLAETFPLRLEDTPAFTNWPGDAGKVHYGEGLFVGYRYYDAKKMPVLFPFGHGLSYTTFEYGNPRVSATSFTDLDGLEVSVDVTNTGTLAGREIVQVYVHDQESSLTRPEKELKGFAEVRLGPGETKSVSIPLTFRSFAFYHPTYKQWVTEEGEFDLLIGASSADIRCELSVMLKSSVNLPCVLDEESTLREWMDDPRGERVLGPYHSKIVDIARDLFGSGGEDRYASESVMGLDIMDMFNDMPLVSVLMFQKGAWEIHPDDLVSELLQQVHRLGQH